MLKKYFNVFILLILIFFSTHQVEARILFPTHKDNLITSPFWSCEVLGLYTCNNTINYIRTPVKVAFMDTGFNLNLQFLKYLPVERTYNSELNKPFPIDDQSGHGTSVISVFIDTIQRIEAEIGQTIPLSYVLVKTTNNVERASEDLLIKSYAFLFIDPSIDVINVSLAGQGYSLNEHNLLQSLYSEKEYKLMQYGYYKTKSMIVVPAGNSGVNLDKIDEYPCSYQIPNSICVGNMNTFTQKTSTNFGYDVDILINGEKIRAVTKNGKYNMLSGTSFATPQISAYLSYARYFYPSLSREQIKNALIKSVESKGLCIYSKSCGLFSFNEFKKLLNLLLLSNETENTIVNQKGK